MSALTMLITCVFYEDTLLAIGSVIHDPRLQGVIASIILFVPSSFILGVISPYLARLRTHSVQTTGRSVAGLSASNSVGGIAGTFFTGFVFFTFIGSRQTLVLLALILIISSWLMDPQEQKRTRAITSIILVLVLILQLATPVRANVVASIDTPSANYTIRNITMDDGKKVRVLIMGPGGWQTGTYLDGSKELVFDYTRKMAEIVKAVPQKDNMLILGGGAFSLPEYLGTKYPNSNIDVVEIDPDLPKIAKKYFGYTQPNNVKIFSQDARAYLEHNSKHYDVILVDIYNDASVPFAMTTKEYTALLNRSLAPTGVTIANIIGSTDQACMPLLASIHKSYTSSFEYAAYYPVVELSMLEKQNIIGVYSNQALDWAGSIPGATNAYFYSGRDLTDNYAPVEYLKQRCDS